MRISILLLALVLDAVAGQEDNSYDCGLCFTDAIKIQLCAENAGCSLEDCYAADDYTECCPACAEDIASVVDCFVDCLDDCVYDTTTAYSSCLQTSIGCQQRCQVAVASAAADIEQNVSEGAAGANKDGDLVFPDLEQEVPLITCDDIQTTYMDKSCEIANCCVACIGQFEALSLCLINDVIFELIGNGETCDVVCDARRLFDSANNSVVERLQNYDEKLPSRELQDIAEQCRRVLAENLAFGNRLNSGQGYIECIQSSMDEIFPSEETLSPATGPTSSGARLTCSLVAELLAHLIV